MTDGITMYPSTTSTTASTTSKKDKGRNSLNRGFSGKYADILMSAPASKGPKNYPGKQSNWLPTASIDILSAFSAEKWKGEIAGAQRSALLKRIVKKHIIEDASSTQYRTYSGKPLSVETFPFFARTEKLREFGCPVAVNLYLTFQIECGILFLLMFLLSLPDLIGNMIRADLRAQCRAMTETDMDYAAITGTLGELGSGVTYDPTLNTTAAALGCGWSDPPLNIRANLTAQSTVLQWGVGTCEEGGPNATFVRTPNAGYCIPGVGAAATLSSLSYWCQFANCLLFFGFLLRLRHNQRMSARKLDRELWSAADYAVMITGLDQGVAADDTSEGKGDGLESRVYADLARLGYDKERIVQVEVGRECREEVDTITALGQIEVREQELLSKVKRAEASRRKPSKKTTEELEKVEKAKAEIQEKLNEFRREPDLTTGHAFVVFLYERDRNKIVKRCRWNGCARWLHKICPCFVSDQRPKWESCSSGRPTVQVAPEPDDIKWANLQLDQAYQNRQVLKVWVVATVLMAIGAFLLVVVESFQDTVETSNAGSWCPVPEGASATMRSVYLNACSTSISLLTSGITIGINMFLRAFLTKMCQSEGLDTNTEYESSLFRKLALAYVMNSAIIPLLVGLFRSSGSISQAWYESGGVVQQAMFLMLSNFIVVESLKTFAAICGSSAAVGTPAEIRFDAACTP